MGDLFGDAVNSFFASAIDQIMTFIWAAAVNLLRGSFELVDGLLGFGDGSDLVDGSGGLGSAAPFAEIWPVLRWIGLSVALGLFFWQLTTTVLRGGAGFWRAATGPVAYGVAAAMTLGVVAALLGAAEGLTTVLLQRGLDADNFRTILDNPDLAFTDNPEVDSQLDSSVRAVLLGLVGLFGVIPAALGFALQMIFRQAAILVLVATVPITAAGLMTNTTASWFWRSLRWMMAAILMKPALALVLVIGVNVLSAPTGIGGLLAGTGVLLISLFCPLVLFRLLAFVEPGTNAGATMRSALSSSGGGGGQPSASSSPEETNSARFDSAQAGGGGGFSGPGPAGAGAGAGGGGAASGAGGAAAGGGSAGAAGGGAGGGALGAVGAVNAAVGAAASFATGYASTTMDATGIGAGQGGFRGSSGGGSRGRGEGGSADGGGSDAGGGSGGSSPGDGTSPPDPAPSGGSPDQGWGSWDPDDDGGGPRGWDGERIGEQRPPERATPAAQGQRSGGGGPGGGGSAGGGAGGAGAGGAGAGGR